MNAKPEHKARCNDELGQHRLESSAHGVAPEQEKEDGRRPVALASRDLLHGIGDADLVVVPELAHASLMAPSVAGRNGHAVGHAGHQATVLGGVHKVFAGELGAVVKLVHVLAGAHRDGALVQVEHLLEPGAHDGAGQVALRLLRSRHPSA
jgi:hypothetical protein